MHALVAVGGGQHGQYQRGQLVGMLEQREQAAADEADGGLVAGGEQQHEHGQNLALGEPVVAFAGLRQRRDEVVARALTGLGKPDKKTVRAKFWEGAARRVG